MTVTERKELELAAVRIREGILTSTFSAGAGHPGGSLSSAELFAWLYFKEMKIEPADPGWENRDRFVLSKGHVTPGLYAALANRGFFPVEDLKGFRSIDSYLQGHPNMNTVPGVDMSTGSLGQGFSAAVGMAKAAKFLDKDINVYTLCGDGEMAEGQIWEAAMSAAHYGLDNLCVFVDVNGLQIDGRTYEVMNTEPLDDKFRAFGFHVIQIDGHDLDELEYAGQRFHDLHGTGVPTAVLMKTVKGKGISYMEDQSGWHGKAPNEEQYRLGMVELSKARRKIEEA